MNDKANFFPLVCLLGMLLFACNPEASQSQVEEKENITDKVEVTKLDQADAASLIEVEAFSEFPPEIDGCACYYSANEADFTSGKYIYMDNFEKMAFMKLNGEMVTFSLSNEKYGDEAGTTQYWETEAVRLIIEKKQVGEIDETWQQRGQILLNLPGGKTQTIDFFGECGC